MAKTKVNIIPDDVLNGFSAAISINVPSPKFDSQAKVRLSGREVEDAIYNALVKEFRSFVDSLSEDQKNDIATKIINNAKIRQAAEVAKVAKKKSITVKSPANLPSNLKDCSMAGKSNLAELHIVEGLSAMGSVSAGRDSSYQAVLPIRGKILNVMKLDLTNKKQRERFQKNAEIEDIIKAIGCGIGDQCDADKSRYGKIIINTDRDVDGYAISVLLLGLFYKLFKPLVEAGMIYEAVTPFFEIKYLKNGKEISEYAITEKERIEIENKLKKSNTKYQVMRAKGLGELNADVFYDTAMNPENRTLTQVTMKDAERANDMLELAIGMVDSDDRKKWMINNSEVIEELGLYQ